MSDNSAIDPAEEPVLVPDAPAMASEPPRESPTAAPPRRTGWTGPVLGGVIAAGLGFGLAQVPPFAGLFTSTAAISAEEFATLQAEVTGLKSALAAVPVTDTTALTTRIDGLETALSTATTPDLGAVEQRLSALENRPVGSLSGADAAALAALQTEVAALKAGGIAQSQVDAASAALQAKLDAAMAATQALQADTAAMATRAARQGALLQIGAALDSGAPFGSALKALDGVTIPPVLVENATGLPSLKSLQDGFPDAARLALDAAVKADMGTGWTDRALSFLRTQVGARSLTPRDGTDPDAILSRAEAALAAGDVPATLTELDALPDLAKTAMAGWRAGADKRQAAQAALATITQEMGL